MLVVQAKSKRLTLEARSGKTEKIERDFGSAIQSAYDQAIRFTDLLILGENCEFGSGKSRKFEFLARAFPIIILSDHFPSLIFLSHNLIKVEEERFPAIFDIFFLNVLLTFLDSPIEVLYYLQQRSRFFRKIHTDVNIICLDFI